MKISCHRVKNLSYILIDEFFTCEELVGVCKEVEALKPFLLVADKTNSAVKNKVVQKTGTGVFLDERYIENREMSFILQSNRKIFCDEVTKTAEEFDVTFNFLKKSNHDTTLVNYYTEGQEYRAHSDESRISAVTFLKRGSISGGEFCFPEQNVTIEAENNRTVIFPSCAVHQAMPVRGKGARISIAQFIDFVFP